jgi:putative endonuclease
MGNTTEKGKQAEAVAEAHYRRRGFTVLARNFRAKTGELDLVLQRGTLLLFVEVKGRQRNWERYAWLSHWGPKIRRLHATVQVFLRRHRDLDYAELRLDIVFVTQGRVSAVFEGI